MSARIRVAARLSSLRGAPARLGAIAGIVTFATLAGTTSSYAYFQATQQASAAATAGTLAVTTSNFTSLAYTFRNDQLDTVGSVTVTNTSDAGNAIPRTVTVSLSATGDAAALANIRYIATVKGTAACSAKNTVSNGTLTENAVGATWSNRTAFSASLAPADSVTYCIESYVRKAADVAAADGSLTLTPTVTASLAAQTWTAEAAATTTESSRAIYPLTTPPSTQWMYIRPVFANDSYRYCLDVSGGGSANGTNIIGYGCKSGGAGNQVWQVAAAATAGYSTIAAYNAATLRAEPGSGSGAAVTTNTASASAAQNWQLQAVSAGVYQIVNRASGYCLAVPSGTGQNLGNVTVSACTGDVTQSFVLSPYVSANPGCTNDGGYNNTTFTLTWTTDNTGPFKIYVGGTLVQTTTAKSVTLGGYSAAQSVVITDSASSYAPGARDTVLATAALTPRTSFFRNNSVCTTSNLVG